MRRAASLCVFAAVVLAGKAVASDEAADPEGRTSLEAALGRLNQERALSFTYSADLLEGLRTADPIDHEAPLRWLRGELSQHGLTLRRVGATSYAISRETAVASLAVEHVEAEPQLVDAIVVSARTSSAGIHQVYGHTLDSELASLLSAQSAAEAVNELPQSLASVSAANTSIFYNVFGANLADFRGLGPSRTLVLSDGRRRAPFASNVSAAVQGVDLNSVAYAFIERIEVVDSAAGARLGPEAVAGALNFVRKDFTDGFESGVDYSISDRGDAREIGVYAAGGGSLADGLLRVSAGVNYIEEEGLIGADRAVTSIGHGYAIDGRAASPSPEAALVPGFGGSVLTPRGRVEGAIDASGAVIPAFFSTGPVPLDGANGLDPFEGRPDQFYNPFSDLTKIVPVDRLNAFFHADMAVGTRTEAFIDATLSHSRANVQIAPLPTLFGRGLGVGYGGAVEIDLTNPIVPDAVRELVQDHYSPSARSVLVSRRYVELGPRESEAQRRYADVVVGLNRAFGDSGEIEAYYRFGDAMNDVRQSGFVDRTRLMLALDAVRCAEVAGCVAVNPFIDNGFSAAAADFIRAPTQASDQRLREHELSATARMSFDFGLAGAADAALGAAVRRTSVAGRDSTPDNGSVIGPPAGAVYDGAQTVFEIFSAIDAPILSQNSPIGAVDIFAAHRVSASSRFSAAHNLDLSLRWSPLRWLEFFGTHHRGALPPNAAQQHYAGPVEAFVFFDPCGQYVGGKSQTLRDNCANDSPLGVSPSFEQTVFLAPSATVGNLRFSPERNRSYSAGFLLQPELERDAVVSAFNLRAAWFDYAIEDGIGGDGRDDLGACFSSPGLSAPTCGVNPNTGLPYIRRDPLTEQIVFISTPEPNDTAIRWRGVDVEMRLALTLPQSLPVDEAWLSAFHSHVHRASFSFGGGAPLELAGLVESPRNRSLIAAGIVRGRTNLAALVNRRGAARTDRSGLPLTRIPAFTTVDLTADYRPTERVVISLAVQNIADRIAPLAASPERPIGIAPPGGGVVLPEYYDLIGRRYTFSLKAAF